MNLTFDDIRPFLWHGKFSGISGRRGLGEEPEGKDNSSSLLKSWNRTQGQNVRKLVYHGREQSNDELGHAEKIGNRIIQLGGTPIMDPGKLLETSGCGYKEPPNDPTNLKQVIQDVLDSEACAIGTYNKLAEKYRMTDLVTHEMFEELLEDEVGDEEEWEKLAGIWNK